MPSCVFLFLPLCRGRSWLPYLQMTPVNVWISVFCSSSFEPAMKTTLASLPTLSKSHVVVNVSLTMQPDPTMTNPGGRRRVNPREYVTFPQGYSWGLLLSDLHGGKQQLTCLSKVKHKVLFYLCSPILRLRLPGEPGHCAPESSHAWAVREQQWGGDERLSWSPRQIRHWTHAAVLLHCTSVHIPDQSLLWPSK